MVDGANSSMKKVIKKEFFARRPSTESIGSSAGPCQVLAGSCWAVFGPQALDRVSRSDRLRPRKRRAKDGTIRNDFVIGEFANVT